MADESLGHIDINFPLGEYTGGEALGSEGKANTAIPDTARVLREIVEAFTKATNFKTGKSSVDQEGFSKPDFGKPAFTQPFSIEFLRELLENVKQINQQVKSSAIFANTNALAPIPSAPKVPTALAPIPSAPSVPTTYHTPTTESIPTTYHSPMVLPSVTTALAPPKKDSFLSKAAGAYKHGKGLYSSISQSESLAGVASSATKGVSSSISGAGAMGAGIMLPVATVAIGIASTVAVVAITLKTIMSQTASVLERVNHLAQFDGKLAMEQALNRLQQMQMDIKEAKILGPLYQQVSQLYRTIMTQLQPIMLVIKTIATTFLVWALETIINLLKLIREFTIYVVRGLATFFGGMAKGGMVSTVGAALTASGKASMGTSPTGALLAQFLGWTLSTGASELQKTSLKAYEALVKILAELEKTNTPSSNSNEYFTTMLDALSIPMVDPFINAPRGQKRATPANVHSVGSKP